MDDETKAELETVRATSPKPDTANQTPRMPGRSTISSTSTTPHPKLTLY
jgi:hypothetical protein